MSAFGYIIAVLAMMAGLLGSMAVLSRIASSRQWHPEVARKIVHVAASGIALPLPWLFEVDWPVWLLLGLSLVAMLAMRTPLLSGTGRALHSVDRDSWGDVLLVVSVALLFLLSNNEPILYVLPLLILALGDAAAALTGSAYGRLFYETKDGQKSVEGSTMFFLVSLILAMACLLLLTDLHRVSVIPVALGVAIFATVVEADSWKGFDNLFLPMGAFLFLFNIFGDVQAVSLAHLLGPALAIPVTFYASRALGMNRQVSRIFAVALFMIVSATNFWNTLLPTLVLVVYALVARSRKETHDVGQTLDVVTGLALVSFGFLALGPATNQQATDFYQLACGAMVVGYAMFGVKSSRSHLRLAAGLFAALLIWLSWRNIITLNGGVEPVGVELQLSAGLVLLTVVLALSFWPSRLQSIKGLAISLLSALPALGLLGFKLAL